MSEGVNKVMLLGHLGADAELRFTQGGQAVLNFRLATTESYLDKDKVRKERTDWHSVVLFGKRGEALSKIIGKGTQLFVEGRLQTSNYEDRDGNKRYKTEIIASNIVLPAKGGAQRAEGRPRDTAPAKPAEAEPDDYGYGGGVGDDDDVPF